MVKYPGFDLFVHFQLLKELTHKKMKKKKRKITVQSL